MPLPPNTNQAATAHRIITSSEPPPIISSIVFEFFVLPFVTSGGGPPGRGGGPPGRGGGPAGVPEVRSGNANEVSYDPAAGVSSNENGRSPAGSGGAANAGG